MKCCTLEGILLTVLLAGPPPAVSAEASATDTPVLIVHARADKPEYVLGEPVRLIVAVVNMSPDSVYFDRCESFCTVQASGERIIYRGGSDWSGDEAVPPLDSLVLFDDATFSSRQVDGAGRTVRFLHDKQTFPLPERYHVRVVCRLRTGGIREFCCRACLVEQTVVSDEVRLTLRRPTRDEARVLDALRGLRHINQFRGGARSRVVRLMDEADGRIPRNTLSPYLLYKAVQTLLNRYLDWVPERTPEVIDILDRLDRIRHDYPGFMPDEVAYWRAMTELRLASLDSLGKDWRRTARDEFVTFVDEQPGLTSNLEYALANLRARERGGEVVLRLRTDKRDYIVGEPMLFRLSMVNVSSREVRVPEPLWWVAGGSGFCARLEVEGSEGKQVPRYFANTTGHYGRRGGVPLAPGDSLVATWDPQVGMFAFGNAGSYRVRAGYQVRASDWTIWGAGRLHLSSPVDITLREPDAREAKIIGVLGKTTGGPYSWRREDMPAVRAALDADPDHPLSFHLHRRLVPDECLHGDFDAAILRLETLRRNSTGMWREDVCTTLLRLYSAYYRSPDPRRAARLAEPVIAELARGDPAIWTDARFVFPAFSALGHPGYLNSGCWRQRMLLLGVKPPSWDELHELMRGPDYGPNPTGSKGP